MSLLVNESDFLSAIGNNSDRATIHPASISNVFAVTVGVVTLTALSFLSKKFVSSSILNKTRTRIPSGPRGLPIVGQL